MTSAANAGIVAGLTALFRASGEPVTYSRGAKSVAIPKAVIGQTVDRGVTDHQLTIRIRRRDFLIRAADLSIDGAGVVPDVGDYIVHESCRFVVTRYEGGEGCFRWSDSATRTVMRIHTEERS